MNLRVIETPRVQKYFELIGHRLSDRLRPYIYIQGLCYSYITLPYINPTPRQIGCETHVYKTYIYETHVHESYTLHILT
jgi:hypothetical protein